MKYLMKTKGIVAMFVLVFSLSYGSSICYADGFDSVRCGSDIRKDQGVVRDVLTFPKHSKDSPQFIGTCQSNGRDLPGTAIGVLKNEDGVAMLPAVIVWKIDDKQMKFVKLPTEGVRCSRNGIITADGGR
jgi:hypothetical protein